MKRFLWIFSFLGALTLIGVGVWLDEPMQTFMNAIMVCLACMGVG